MNAPSTAPRAIVCTGNAHKVEELAGLLPELKLEPLAPGTPLPEETGTTFVDNARIKAVAGHERFPDAWVIADDSGLIVDALDGAPGVYSARFAGEGSSDRENLELLLDRLEGVSGARRSARFACVLVAIAPDGGELIAEGFVEGTIADHPAGESGFGYDPVFVPLGHDQSFAQLGAETKAQLSHRAHAARALHDQLLALQAAGAS